MKDFLKNNKWLIVFSFIIFIFSFIFFRSIHPLVVSDTDDWLYLAETRAIIPLWGIWNPAKVFPEVFQPICNSFAAFVIYPFTNNYMGSFSLVYAFVVSFFITIYISLFTKLIITKYELKNSIGISIGLIFYLIHYVLLIHPFVTNTYLFYENDVTCYFNYLIPNLLCFSIVFYMELHEDLDLSINFPKNIKYGFFILLIYLSIFSNLYCSIVLVIYSFLKLLKQFILNIKSFKIISFLKNNFIYFLTFIFWVISAIFELSGQRAQYATKIPFIPSLKESIKNWIKSILSINPVLLVIIGLIIVSFIITYFKTKNNKKDYKPYILCFLGFGLISCFFILLCAKVDPSYMFRADCVFGMFVFLLLFTFFAFTYLIKRFNSINVLFPFIIVALLTEINLYYNTFYESNVLNLEPSIFININNDIIEQIVEAEKEGKTDMELYIPKFQTSDNWPYANYSGLRICNTLLKHKIIHYPIDITIVPDEDLNESFNIR